MNPTHARPGAVDPAPALGRATNGAGAAWVTPEAGGVGSTPRAGGMA